MTSLLRENWGAFSLENAISLDTAIEEWTQYLINPLEILCDFPCWEVTNPGIAYKISSGNSFLMPENFPNTDKVLLLGENHTLLAIAGKKQREDLRWEIQPYKVFK